MVFDGGWVHQPNFLLGIINVSFIQSLVVIGPLEYFSEFFNKIFCQIFYF